MHPDGTGTDTLATVVVVNFNGRRHLLDCLTALERQTLPRRCYEVLFIDNGSRDGSADFVRAHFPHVRVVVIRDNVGYVGANNLGLSQTRGRYVVLLNNDTCVAAGWLEALMAAANSGG